MTRHEDLKVFTGESDWFVTITIPTPSNVADARARFELEWGNARGMLSDRWGAADLDGLDHAVERLQHHDGAGLVVVHAREGSTMVEVLDEPATAATVHEGPVPRWATVIEARQRTIPHVVVEADRAGADLTAFDGGSVLSAATVVGDTEHIHRGHPGGWSQRRFQQRGENTWEGNARHVADAVADLAREVGARLVAVAGDVRATTFVLEHLPADVRDLTVKIEAGSPEGIADEVVRLLSSLVAEQVTAAAARLRAGSGTGLSSADHRVVLEALREGRVDTLLVHDEDSVHDGAGELDRARLVDRAIVAALATGADILVVPRLAVMDGPVAATMRW